MQSQRVSDVSSKKGAHFAALVYSSLPSSTSYDEPSTVRRRENAPSGHFLILDHVCYP